MDYLRRGTCTRQRIFLDQLSRPSRRPDRILSLISPIRVGSQGEHFLSYAIAFPFLYVFLFLFLFRITFALYANFNRPRNINRKLYALETRRIIKVYSDRVLPARDSIIRHLSVASNINIRTTDITGARLTRNKHRRIGRVCSSMLVRSVSKVCT